MKIARVFPTKTNMSPSDADAYFDNPDMFTPFYDEVHISCVFTWDKKKAEDLMYQWGRSGSKVIIGGPAYDSPSGDFVSGKYLKAGVTITSRGCPNNCSFCYVPKREGKIKELPIVPGNIIQDNNILACSKKHLEKVFDMLKKQKAIEFRGGLESRRITVEIADALRSLKIKTLWLACDTDGAIEGLRKAAEILLKAGFNRNNLFCYVLVGKDIKNDEDRLMAVWDSGCMPFAQLCKPGEYSREYKQFQRKWSRPAIIKSIIKNRQKI